MRIIMICMDSENTVVYLDSDADLVGPKTIQAWVEACCDEPVNDVFYIKQEELQYYCIDGRIHLTESQERQVYEKYKPAV